MENIGYVGVLKIQIRIYESFSVKEKRRILRSIEDKIKYKYNFSYGELGLQDIHNAAILGFTCISSDYKHCQKMLDKIARLLDSSSDYEIVNRVEYIV